jgi:hypothetical protein
MKLIFPLMIAILSPAWVTHSFALLGPHIPWKSVARKYYETSASSVTLRAAVSISDDTKSQVVVQDDKDGGKTCLKIAVVGAGAVGSYYGARKYDGGSASC